MRPFTFMDPHGSWIRHVHLRKNIVLRADGRIERTCVHGVGHPIGHIRQWESWMGIHGCCGLCSTWAHGSKRDKREKSRAIATTFVTDINSRTFCTACGGQPIEWHRNEHELHPNWRVSSLRAQGTSVKRIRAEMALCTPLCRSCHMKLDGRSVALFAAQPNQPGVTTVFAKPCKICEKEAKPLRRGLCYGCYERHREGGRHFQHVLCDGCCHDWPRQPLPDA